MKEIESNARVIKLTRLDKPYCSKCAPHTGCNANSLNQYLKTIRGKNVSWKFKKKHKHAKKQFE